MRDSLEKMSRPTSHGWKSHLSPYPKSLKIGQIVLSAGQLKLDLSLPRE